MIIRGTIRSTETWGAEASALDPDDARAELERMLPEGFMLDTVLTTYAKIGEPYQLSATGRSTRTQELQAEGPDYPSARAALEAQVPEGWILLKVTTEE